MNLLHIRQERVRQCLCYFVHAQLMCHLQELQKLRDAPHAPETPRTLTSKRSFFGRSKSTALERDALAAQVQQLEEQVQQLTEKRVELERTKVKLEGQLAEATQNARAARNENATLEERVSYRRRCFLPVSPFFFNRWCLGRVSPLTVLHVSTSHAPLGVLQWLQHY